MRFPKSANNTPPAEQPDKPLQTHVTNSSHSQLHPKDVGEGRARLVCSAPLSFPGEGVGQLSVVMGSCNQDTGTFLCRFSQDIGRQATSLTATAEHFEARLRSG